MDTRRLPRVEKNADDPTVPASSSRHLTRRESTTLTTLSRLFAVQASTSPQTSRNSSYTNRQDRHVADYVRALSSSDVSTLRGHLHIRGLISGRHSDITVKAFGQQYRLHRIILDRAPFFAKALSEPWLEAKQDEITIHPEDVDPSISQAAFELALRRLYGSAAPEEEARDAISLFATSCWLEMDDLVESSIESMLRQMKPETLAPLVKLVTVNYYGRAGDKILASAKAMLCRDGWRMPVCLWDDLPATLVRDIVGGDGFFVDGEWDRWLLAKRILDRRLRAHAEANHLLEPVTRQDTRIPPDLSYLMSVRCDSAFRRGCTESGPEDMREWASFYVDVEVEPILALLDRGIHYLHLAFEQLQFIRRSKDWLGLPAVPEHIISNALWQQMELRQTIVNASEPDLNLGLAVACADDPASDDSSGDSQLSFISLSELQNSPGGKEPTRQDTHPESADMEPWDSSSVPRKYWIPNCDRNTVLGGSTEPVFGTPVATAGGYTNEPGTPVKALERTRATGSFEAGGTHKSKAKRSRDGASYTHFPPFRFSAEFSNARLLKDRERVYSRTVFYAGSLWNMYIKKIVSRRMELGVYLHRAREHETEEVIANTAGRAQGSVDERIGQLEREMLLRSERRSSRLQRGLLGPVFPHSDPEPVSAEDQQPADHETVPMNNEELSVRASTMRSLLGRAHRRGPSSTAPTQPPSSFSSPPAAQEADPTPTPPDAGDPDSSNDDDTVDNETLKGLYVPTVPPYVDARPTIKTYFKIYSPSRGGRLLSVYESAPDNFNFSQSWGWESSALMVDEGLWSDEAEEQHSPSAARENAGEGTERKAGKGLNDGKLRFMVVIGNV